MEWTPYSIGQAFNGVNNPPVPQKKFILKLVKDRQRRLYWLFEAKKRL
jgi:hypothetical protein